MNTQLAYRQASLPVRRSAPLCAASQPAFGRIAEGALGGHGLDSVTKSSATLDRAPLAIGGFANAEVER